MTTSSTDSAAVVATGGATTAQDQITLLRGTGDHRARLRRRRGPAVHLRLRGPTSRRGSRSRSGPGWRRTPPRSSCSSACSPPLQAHRAHRVWLDGRRRARRGGRCGRRPVPGARSLLRGATPTPTDPTRDAEVLSGFLLGVDLGRDRHVGAGHPPERRASGPGRRPGTPCTSRWRSRRSSRRRSGCAARSPRGCTARCSRSSSSSTPGWATSSRARRPRLDADDVESLAWVRTELDEAREIDVREMSRLLYPDRLELGLVPALRALLGRIPASIATRLTVSDAVRSLDDPTASAPDGQRAAARRPRGRGGG